VKIGILPASGKANRVRGLPKFALPVSDELSLLEWHFNLLSSCVDEIRIVTREQWAPVINAMTLGGCEILLKEPSSMSDAVNFAVYNEGDSHVVGMPDTYIQESTESHYTWLCQQTNNLSLALWECPPGLRGKVGQVLLNSNSTVSEVRDKDPQCSYPLMWGAFAFSNFKLNPHLTSPSYDFIEQISLNGSVIGRKFEGEYYDLGTFHSLKKFYSTVT